MTNRSVERYKIVTAVAGDLQKNETFFHKYLIISFHRLFLNNIIN